MNPCALEILKNLGRGIGLVFLVLWCLAGVRYLLLPVLGLILVTYILAGFGKPHLSLKYLWIGFWALLIFFPLDISFKHFSDHPRIVRYVVGMPTRAALQKAEKGEIMLAGCSTVLIEPQWVLVR